MDKVLNMFMILRVLFSFTFTGTSSLETTVWLFICNLDIKVPILVAGGQGLLCPSVGF